MTSYVALLVFEQHNQTTGQVLYSEEFYVLNADSLEQAQGKAQARGVEQATQFHNDAGEVLKLRLRRVLDVQQALYKDPSHGPLYVRHFRNLDAYRAFEPLLDGEL